MNPGPEVIRLEPVELAAVRTPTLEALQAALRHRSIERPLIADLSLGAWKPHQAARELLAQLGLPAPVPEPTAEICAAQPSGDFAYADEAGRGVDAEAGGERAIRQAHALARRIADWATGAVVVLPPRFGAVWNLPEAALVYFLAQLLSPPRCRLLLAVVEPGDPVLPAGWRLSEVDEERCAESAPPPARAGLLGLVAGTVDPAVLGLFAGGCPAGGALPRLWSLRGGCALIAPEDRRDPRQVPAFEHDWLALVAHAIPWLAAQAQCHTGGEMVCSGFLAGQAEACLTEGCTDLGLRLLDHAARWSSGADEAAVLQVKAQAWRIGELRFAEAAAAPDPPAHLPDPLRGFLWQTKGWGLVMTRGGEEAEPCFAEARRLLEPYAGRREHLYLLNISALAKLRAGRPDEALELEHRIEAALSALPRPDWALLYINSINLARLFRHLGDLPSATRSLERALSTTEGLRTDNDAVYANHTLADLASRAGRPAEAFPLFLRAALHWVSMAVPEAVASRTAAALLGRRWPLQKAASVEEISAAVASRLEALAREAGVGPLLAAASVPVFVRSGDLAEELATGASLTAIGAPGVGVFVTDRPLAPRLDGPCLRRLRGLLLAALQTLGSVPELAGSRVVVIDDRLGREIPANRGELLEAAVRLGAARFLYGGERRELTAGERANLEQEMPVELSPAIDRIEPDGDGVRVVFKRFLPPLRLDAAAALVLAALDRGPTLAELSLRLGGGPETAGLARLIRRLEQSRVVVRTGAIPEPALLALGGAR